MLTIFTMLARQALAFSRLHALPPGGAAAGGHAGTDLHARADRHAGMRVLRDVMVAMRDGVHLATDIYLPHYDGADGEGGADAALALPVILERTPYGKHLRSRSERGPGHSEAMERADIARYFVARGYAVVYQDCRGRYGSEGRFIKYTSDADDGYDTCAWILAQGWCNGRIGTKGLSYAAHTQAALGSAGAPGVVAMVLDSGGFSNAYHSGIRHGGAFEMKQVTWALGQALESESVRADPDSRRALMSINLMEWFCKVNEWAPGSSPLSAAPEYEDYVFEQWRNGAFGDYWRRPGLFAQGYYDRFCQAATMHISSWYDPYARSACENYTGLVAAGRGPAHLILGPWTHGNRFLSFAGDVDFGPHATLHGNLASDFLALRLDWFERHLKQDDGATEPFPVRLFVMGGGSGQKNAAGRREHGGNWRAEPAWPLARAREVPYYLHAGGALSSTRPQAADAALDYLHDPLDPTVTNGGAVTSGEPLMYGGAFDQGPVQQQVRGQAPGQAHAAQAVAGVGVLSFVSAALEQDTEVTGVIRAHLWVASDCLDTDFTFKLIDLAPPNDDYPDGYAMNLTDGILRMRYRDSWETPALMTPGQRYAICIEALPTSNLFKRGHALRIDISSSNFPRYDVNPNTGAAEGFSGPVKVARNTVFAQADAASHIVLPIVPLRDARVLG